MRIRARNVAIWAGLAAALAIIIVVVVTRMQPATITITGVVLRQDSDPTKQLPIPDVKVAAVDASVSATGESNTAGLFTLKLPNDVWRNRTALLTFEHPGYRSADISAPLNEQTRGTVYVVRMNPIPGETAPPMTGHETVIKDVRIRYSERTSNTVNVGSTAKTFSVPNIGNVPCAGHPPCSPDGKWKASVGAVTLDAGAGQQFQNARVFCIAGPCPFSKIETGAIPSPGRTLTVTVRNWSDTVTYLVEAEVTRNAPSDAVRQAYPARSGRSMSFTLPSSAQGPSIEADLGGSEIIFPLGPALRLSWADCTLETGADQTKLYRCELKPGYEFQP